MSSQLRIVSGPDAGRTVPLPEKPAVEIGRSNQTDVEIRDPAVSRIHCRLTRYNDKLILADLASRSGTFVNGQRVVEYTLGPLDVIKIGTTEFLIEPEPAPGAPASEKIVTALKPSTGLDKPLPLLSGDAMKELTGHKFGQYMLNFALASGRSGMVFRATDTKFERPVAVKILWPESSRDDRQVKRFVRAMKTMMPLQHPNLVTIYGAGKTGAYCWVAMEYVEGKSLAQILFKTGTPNVLSWQQALKVMTDVSKALVLAHQNQIIHRNIVPANVLLRTADQTAKLGDLMLAKALTGELAEEITNQGQLLGDLRYLSPEQTSGLSKEVGERSDIYGLGTVAYAMLTGRPPVEGRSPVETIIKIRQQEPEPPSLIQPGIPAEFEKVVLKMLAKRPEDRYGSAAELLGVLEKFAKK